MSYPGKNALGWDKFRVRDDPYKPVYEAWEIVSVRPTTELRSFKRILGVNLSSEYRVLDDGYTGVRAAPSYSQAELENMVAANQQAYETATPELLSIAKRSSYAQDLANRVFDLPGPLPSKVGQLLDHRLVATNKCPYAGREWKIAALPAMEDWMTDEAPRAKGWSLFKRSGVSQEYPVHKWLIVLRGQETKTSQGFEAFDMHSNPWLKMDVMDNDAQY
ncbi:Uu.00g006390.m01.CDS01 [Anthostomella pinea]|uniref:Uu.00g006390.m01.CDS01 n=1 Tax=Anthostomella pinea TaxID=933095 RepID=A0AAI8YGK7_9PEZI|nr:Uu.00g006390.m01.CDS01 [Anthostomella pinea]